MKPTPAQWLLLPWLAGAMYLQWSGIHRAVEIACGTYVGGYFIAKYFRSGNNPH